MGHVRGQPLPFGLQAGHAVLPEERVQHSHGVRCVRNRFLSLSGRALAWCCKVKWLQFLLASQSTGEVAVV